MIRMTSTVDIEEEYEDGDEPQRETAYMENQPNVKVIQGRTSYNMQKQNPTRIR
jgi:hypothetical protein